MFYGICFLADDDKRSVQNWTGLILHFHANLLLTAEQCLRREALSPQAGLEEIEEWSNLSLNVMPNDGARWRVGIGSRQGAQGRFWDGSTAVSDRAPLRRRACRVASRGPVGSHARSLGGLYLATLLLLPRAPPTVAAECGNLCQPEPVGCPYGKVRFASSR